MALGYDKQRQVVALNDTVALPAYIYDDQDRPIPDAGTPGATTNLAVNYVIQKPDGTRTTLSGAIQPDGSGLVQFGGTNLVGKYVVVATFNLSDGQIRSTRSDFEVFDPFEEAQSQILTIAEAVWQRLEDCFDGEDEGPWLRDQSNNFFTEEKMAQFVNDALFDINQWNPPTGFVLGDFVQMDGTITPSTPLLAQGVLVVVIRQMMRAYTEQPLPSGAQVAYQERRDYLDRWRAVYQEEKTTYFQWVKLWKRQFLHLGHSKTLVGSKAGRLIPAPQRTRNVGRGYF